MHQQDAAGGALFVLRFGIEWQDDDGALWPFTLEVAEHDGDYRDQLAGFRRTLWYGLAAVALALLLVQAAVLAWGLRPLHRLGGELQAIAQGRRRHLRGRYPSEIAPLTDAINDFVDQQRTSRDRYRDSLADLAHSLKTPMAVLGAAVDGTAIEAGAVRDQVARMSDIVSYQLGRAATAGRSPLSASVALRPLLDSLRRSLDKVYAGRDLQWHIDVGDALRFDGDRGDLLEMLGNLLDNACQWAHHDVSCRSYRDQHGGLCLVVEDDGPGVPPGERERLLLRGQRGGADGDGQGIGLAVVADIVSAYGGRLSLHHSTRGGLRVLLEFPPIRA